MAASAVPHPSTLDRFTPRVMAQGLVLVIVGASGFVDMATSLPVGPLSAQALLTIAYFLAGVVLLAITPVTAAQSQAKLLPLLLFVLWTACSLAWTPNTMRGIQNVLVIAIFAILLRVAEGTSAASPHFAFWLVRLLRNAAVLAAAIYAVSAVWFGPGTYAVIGPRSFGLFALFGVAHFLSGWRYGSRRSLLAAIALTIVIGVSQSRLALGIAVVLFPMAQLPAAGIGRTFKMAGVVLVAALASYGAFFYFQSLRERFLTGDVSLRVGSLAINGSGRAAFWRTTADSFLESPLVGKGAGSSEGLIESVYVKMRHPHNDYLRIAHDYGVIGSVLWWLGVGGIAAALWRSWRLADRTFRTGARLELTALLSLSAFALEMAAENTMVYVFVAAPLGLLTGSALGLSRLIRSSAAAAQLRLR